MKEKALINWFVLGNIIDIALTLYFLGQGLGTELNPLARQMMAEGGVVELLIIKISYSAVLIGAYALATGMDNRLRFTTEKALQISIPLLWIVQVWNVFNLVAAVGS